MKTRLGLTFLATGTLLLAAVSACGNDGSDPAPSGSTASASSSPTAPITSPSTASPDDSASTAATAVVTDYYAVLDKLRSDPSSDLKPLRTVATSIQLKAIQTLIRREHEQGRRQTGTTSINDLKVQSVSLDNAGQASGPLPTVVVDVCWDVSKVDVLDANGKSVVAADRPDTGWTRFTVANYTYDAQPVDGWRVAGGQDLKQAPCTAS